jgi:hypothetical protein
MLAYAIITKMSGEISFTRHFDYYEFRLFKFLI